MRYIAAEDVAKAKEMDLLTYLRNYEPQELVHVSGNTYCTREHDSLRISNGKWCWFSQGIGGRSALDYLIKVKGIPFTQAAEIILGREAEKPPVFYRQKERRSTELLMPELSETTEQVEKYLYSRGIHPAIIRYCLDNRLLFESADYHNAVFVGHDKDGKARYGALRSTVSSYKGELTGSDKRFSFFLEGKPNAEHTQNIGKSFMKSYASVCLEGAIIVLACIIFSVFASSPPVVDPNAAPASMVWSYIGELIFNMLILVGAVKMADRLVKEMMGI